MCVSEQSPGEALAQIIDNQNEIKRALARLAEELRELHGGMNSIVLRLALAEMAAAERVEEAA